MDEKTGRYEFANLDFRREQRTGMGETVYCPGKTCAQLADIIRAFQDVGKSVLCTKATAEQMTYVGDRIQCLECDPVSGVIRYSAGARSRLPGRVAVCTGGTADIPVAEEAALTVDFFGAAADRYYDIGVAGIHRLFSKLESIRSADVVIAVAGMEGALGSVISGLVSVPVVAVPTSVGYGASFSGLAPLLSMLNSCAEGMAVVNIDNGFGAAVMACRIIRSAKRIGEV